MSHQPGGQITLPDPPATIHLVGIGGIGMSGLARLLASRGYRITGSDAAHSPLVDELRAEGFTVVVGHDAANLGAPDLVIATAAATASNVELAAAQERGIPIIKRAAALGLLASLSDCIAVAGTHGKSTTSGMIALALDRAGRAPSFAVGAEVRELGTNARAGRGRLFVAEADEYDYSFLWLRPLVAVVTSIEHDHPDLFPTLDAVDGAFARFVAGIRAGGALVACRDDEGCRRLLASLDDPPFRVVTYGFRPDAGWRAERVAGWDIFRGPDGQTLRLRLRVPGNHNRLNALAAVAAAHAAGVEPAALIAGLEEFGGVGRRFEARGEVDGVTVIDDYAHHPTEIRATISAARERYPGGRLTVVFQPHTFSRTKGLLPDFAAALELADRVVLCPIYPSREADDLGVSSEQIAERMTRIRAEVGVDLQDAGRIAADGPRAGDVVLVAGAGDVWKAGDEILRRLRSRARNREPGSETR